MSVLQPSRTSWIEKLESSESTEFSLGEVKIDTNSPFFRKSLPQLDLHGKFGVLPAGISRNGQLLRDFAQSEQLQDQDVLFILGKQENIDVVKNK